MPSSTSSSDIPYRDIPERNWGLAWMICVVLVIAAVTGWELKAREMQHLPGDYDGFTNFTIQWAEERRKLDEPGHGYRILLLGSSRMLWAADLDILEQGLGTRPVYGLGPATTPSSSSMKSATTRLHGMPRASTPIGIAETPSSSTTTAMTTRAASCLSAITAEPSRI